MQDLQHYLCDESVRADHMSRMEMEFNFLLTRGASAEQLESVAPKPIDLDWLALHIKTLQPVADAAAGALDSFTGGVVYGVRVDKADLPSLTYCSTMGIKACSALSSTRIVCKMEIPDSYVYNHSAIEIDIELMVSKCGSGVIQAISSQRRVGGR